MKNITIRDSGNKEVLEAYFLNHEGQPYNLENKTVTFMENKDGDKFVSDPNVQIVNATAGFVRYTLQSQVHSAPGIAWFEINDDSGLVDSTGNFNIRVENGLRATADNTTYIGALEKLKQQMESLIQQADGELKAELQKAEQQLNQELQDFRNQYNSLSNDFQNQFKTAQNARQQDYNNQKNDINTDWNESKGIIWGQWINDKASIDKQAQDTVQAIKDNAKQVLDKDQADWNAKQNQWDSTFSAIVKEWQVKTNSLNATVQDLTNKFNTIISKVSDLMNNQLTTMNAKADASQKKIEELRKELSNVDWTSFVKPKDFLGDTVNYYEGTADFSGAAWIGSPINLNDGWTNLDLPATKYIGPWEGIGQDLWVEAGDYITISAYIDVNNATKEGKLFGYIQYADGRRTGAAEVDLTAYGIVGSNSAPYSDSILSFKAGQSINWTHVYVTGKARTQGYVCPRFESNVANDNGFFINRINVTKTPFPMPWQPNSLDQATKDYVNDSVRIKQIGWQDIESNLNNWQLNDVMKQAARIRYQSNTRMSILDYYGVAGQEEATLNINNLNTDASYTITFDFEAPTTLPKLDGNYSWGVYVYDKNGSNLGQVSLPYHKGRKQEYAINVWQNTGSVNLKIISSGIADGQKCRWAIGNVRIREQPLLPHNIGYVLNKIKIRTQSLDQNGDTFTNTQTATKQSDGSYVINTYDNDWTAYKVSWLLKNTKSYNIEANTNLNDIKAPGLYYCSGSANIVNVPGGEDNWFDMIVNSDGWNGSQTFYATNSNQLYVRTWNNGGFTEWRRLANIDDLSKVKIRLQSLDQNGNTFTNIQTANKQSDGSYVINIYDNDWTAYKVSWLLKNTKSYNIEANTNLNDIKAPGLYYCSGSANIVNVPGGEDNWFDMIVNSDGWNGSQTFYATNSNQLYVRTWNNGGFTEWNKFAMMNSVTDLSDKLQSFTMQQTMFQHRVDYDSPSGTISDDTVDFNNYRETGILKVVNCLIQNGPYKSDNRHTVFLKITNLDGQTQYQTVYEGDNLYGRKLYNGSGQWHKYTNTPI